MTDTALPAQRDAWLAVRRGLALRCPACGKGRILAGYLKPAASCSCCNESFSDIRADDGPAWATILLVGHLVSPMFVIFATRDRAATWVPFLVMAALVIGLTLAILPRMKGLFVGAIWGNRAGETGAGETAAN